MGIRKSKIKIECASCHYLDEDKPQAYKCYTPGCPAYEQDQEVVEAEVVDDDVPPEDMDCDLICPCGSMTFLIRIADGDTMAICSECGESTEID